MYKVIELTNCENTTDNAVMSASFVGSFHFDDIVNNAANAAAEQLQIKDFSVYRVDYKDRVLRPIGLITNPKLKFDFYKLFKKRFNSLSTPIDNPVNLMGRTIKEKKGFLSTDLGEFIKGAVSLYVIKTIDVITPDLDLNISMPCMGLGQVWGALLAAFSSMRTSESEVVRKMEIIAGQVGLAMANAAAHEKVVERFKHLYLAKNRKINDEKADIKFTLRITPKIEKYFTWKIQNTDLNKADFVRNRIEQEIDKDGDFQEYLKGSVNNIK